MRRWHRSAARDGCCTRRVLKFPSLVEWSSVEWSPFERLFGASPAEQPTKSLAWLAVQDVSSLQPGTARLVQPAADQVEFPGAVRICQLRCNNPQSSGRKFPTS